MSADFPVQMLRRQKPKKTDKTKSRRGRFLLLMSDEVKAAIEKAACGNYRTRTAEINMRLEASFKNEVVFDHGVMVATAPLLKSDRTPRSHT